MNIGRVDWDAETYERVSDPQFEWGLEVLERLELAGDEHVMDAGCGSGRVTARLLKRLPRGRVIAVDASESMIEKAREKLGDRVDYLVADLAELELSEPVDVVFSTATFHWISDHDRLFARLHDALVPGGGLHRGPRMAAAEAGAPREPQGVHESRDPRAPPRTPAGGSARPVHRCRRE